MNLHKLLRGMLTLWWYGQDHRLYLIQLMGFVARSEAEAHRLQVNAVHVMRAGNCKGLVDPSMKGVPFKSIRGKGYLFLIVTSFNGR